MIVLGSGIMNAILKLGFQTQMHFGHLVTPRNGTSMSTILDSGWHWAADNDAFLKWDEDRFRRMLTRVAGHPKCLFVACPDVVGDAKATLERFHSWRPDLAAIGQPIAFVGQDGCESMDLPWDEFAAFFVGGSTAWKISAAAAAMVAEARARDKWVHMGRVNSNRRLRIAYDLGCDSVDGTSHSQWSDIYLPMRKRCLDNLARQPLLPGMEP